MRIAATLLLLAASLFAAPIVVAAPARWTPASFRGVAVGSAHRAEAVRLLGPPDSDTRTRGGEELIYKARGDHKGDLTVSLDRSGIVFEIKESFPVAIPRSRMYKELGQDALTAHFSQARCAGNTLYRDPAGAIELTLYPARGIVLWPDQFGYDFAAILYVAHQPGASRAPPCIARR
jgi:hypothetical protein